MSESYKFLVVDDEEIIRIGCQRMLEDAGYQVDLAENGRIGLEHIQENKYDLALIDLMMPELGGLQLLDEIQKIDRNLVSIIITGFATIETAVDAIKRGAYDYLPKPFTPDEFRTKINRGLEKRRLALEADRLQQEVNKNLLEVSQQKNQTHTIINCMSEGVIATTLTGQIGLINPGAIKMLRLKDLKIIGRTVDGLLGNPDLEKEIQESLAKVTRGTSMTTLNITTSDGRALQANIAPIIDETDACLGTVTVLTDLTEEKKIEEMKSNFVSLVSHELRAPVAAIEGYLDLILEGITAGNASKEKEIIRKSRDRAAGLLDLINDLLDLSRTDRSKTLKVMAPVNIDQIIKETVDFYQNEARDKEILLNLNVAENLPTLRGNKEDLARLFANLIGNAIKYTPGRGQVNVTVSMHNSHLVVAVKDNGIGIAKEDLPRIFDQFYRAKNAVDKKISGTGLGLSIAKKIVEEHNGYIEVDSEAGKGTTFSVFMMAPEKRVI
jgi:two-component system, OmpR family, phosphate regulon sensor histidine kinase PhoR